MNKKEIIKQLKNGYDIEARIYLADKIEKLLLESGKGELSLAGLLDGLKKVTKEGKEMIEETK